MTANQGVFKTGDQAWKEWHPFLGLKGSDFFFENKGEGHPETMLPSVIKVMTKDRDHGL